MPEFDAPELPPVLPPPPPHAFGASEMLLPVEREISAAELGILGSTPDGSQITLSLRRCSFAAAEPNWQAEPDSTCRLVNQGSVHLRTQQAIVVHPGEYEFVVENQAFDRGLGLWLRREDDPNIPVITGGGAALDGNNRWHAELLPGRYIYSCPLSPTPDYLMIVR